MKYFKFFKNFFNEIINYNQLLMFLSINDIRLRYKRTTLGPFWISLGTFLLILIIGPVYSIIFDIGYDSYIYYLSVSIILWSFFVSTINAVATSLIHSEAFIKDYNLPVQIYVLRSIYRELIVFTHNIPIFIYVVMMSRKL